MNTACHRPKVNMTTRSSNKFPGPVPNPPPHYPLLITVSLLLLSLIPTYRHNQSLTSLPACCPLFHTVVQAESSEAQLRSLLKNLGWLPFICKGKFILTIWLSGPFITWPQLPCQFISHTSLHANLNLRSNWTPCNFPPHNFSLPGLCF